MASRMHLFAAVLVITLVVVLSGRHNCTSCSPKCGPNEYPVKGKPRRDAFCRPLYTPRDVWTKLRTCLCKRGYVRNSWDECVPRKDCRRCRCRLQKEWHLCASPCPVTCNKTIEKCTKPCSPGCDCPPGWVLDPRDWRKCVKAKKCVPQCPQNSTFQPCVSSCEPKCGKKVREQCVSQCHRGSCVCDKGFTEYVKDGKQSCLLKESCSLHLSEKPLVVLNGSGMSSTRTPTLSSTTGRPQSTPPSSTAESGNPSRATRTPSSSITESAGHNGVNPATSAPGMHTHTTGETNLSGATANAGSTSALNTTIRGGMHRTAGALSAVIETSLNAPTNVVSVGSISATVVPSGVRPPAASAGNAATTTTTPTDLTAATAGTAPTAATAGAAATAASAGTAATAASAASAPSASSAATGATVATGSTAADATTGTAVSIAPTS
uniref:TIL domain containing protein n=1 Tax=Rhipicephalus zambeziensis TaxID=60191 RepID=A0A224YRR8_9ACAR